ncbi:MAG: tail Collar domain-containing protein [Nitrospira sp.]
MGPLPRFIVAALIWCCFEMPSPTPAQTGAQTYPPYQPFVGQLMMTATNRCPVGWAKADGQLLSVTQYNPLFALLGYMYGGSGQTFALPDLRGRVMLHWGNAPGGLATQAPGQRGGEVMHALTVNEMPPHQHPLNTSTGRATESSATGNLLSAQEEHSFVRPEMGKTTPLHAMSVGPSGAGVPHNVMPPYLTITVCIALEGVFPHDP